MSSGESESMFESVAKVIRARLSNTKGVEKVLDHLAIRAKTDDKNPLSNRTLIIEPIKLAQRIDVPRSTVEAVVEELQVFNLVHLWVRAICPVVEAEDDNVIVETDNPEKLRAELGATCGHCGGYHEELDWSCFQTFYAIHLDGQRGRFDIRRLFRNRPSAEAPLASTPSSNKDNFLGLALWIGSFFGLGQGSPKF